MLHTTGCICPILRAIFDVAFAICVFHHVPVSNRESLVGEIHRVLRPGGLFVIFEHNTLNPLTMYVVNRCRFDENAILLRRNETEALLENAGFRDVTTRYILAIPALGLMRRIIVEFHFPSSSSRCSVLHCGPGISYRRKLQSIPQFSFRPKGDWDRLTFAKLAQWVANQRGQHGGRSSAFRFRPAANDLRSKAARRDRRRALTKIESWTMPSSIRSGHPCHLLSSADNEF